MDADTHDIHVIQTAETDFRNPTKRYFASSVRLTLGSVDVERIDLALAHLRKVLLATLMDGDGPVKIQVQLTCANSEHEHVQSLPEHQLFDVIPVKEV